LAANKRKILENARKLAQKGSKDKALAEYQKLVQLDPKDAKLRLEIGDAYRRWGQVEEAVETYSRVAEQYMKEGFDARAVAVYKQILNLDPDRSSAHEPLAELYERMGLTAEAIGALQTAADGHHRAGRKREALGLLRKMATIDPTNTNSRIKVAELLRQEEMLEEAVLEYDEVARELSRQGDVEGEAKIHRRILEIDPDRVATLAAFARGLLALGKSTEAEVVAKRAVSKQDDEPAHYELLADVYRAQGREDLLPEVYRPLAELYRRRGDEERARDIAQRFVPSDGVSADRASGREDLFGESPDSQALPDELSLDGTSFGPGEGMEMELGPELEVGRQDDALDLGTPIEPVGAEATRYGDDSIGTFAGETSSGVTHARMDAGKKPPERAPAVTGDPDQLFAEASVYLRYGKRDRAITHLRAILDQEPDHRSALEKLGEAYAESGDTEHAVEHWLHAAKRAREESDEDAVAVLRDRIAALDPDAAASLGAAAEPEAPPAPDLGDTPDPLEDFDEISESELSQPELSQPELSQDEPEPEDLSEHDLDVDIEDEEPAVAEDEAAPEPQVAAPGGPRSGASASGSLSTSTAQQILEDLEEADFYMDQGLLDEAEEIYQRVLAVAPNHPRALVRLGEVTAARSGRPVVRPAGLDAPSKAPARRAAEPKRKAVEPEPEPEALASEPVGRDLAPEPAPGQADDSLDLGVDLDGEDAVDPVDAGADADSEAAGDGDSDPDTAAEPPPEDVTGEFSVPTGSFPKVKQSRSPVFEGEADFDLAAELSDVFDDAGDSGSGVGDGTDDGFAAVFEAFKRGVSETLSEADHEAHYDLGIAYKEMGLYDDAIQEFRSAMVHPPRVPECLHLIALCALDAGRGPLAVEHLEQLLEGDAATDDQRLAARYDLGRAHEALGNLAEARAAYQAVRSVSASYQDVVERLSAVSGPPDAGRGAGGSAASDFESFDDVISESHDDAPDDARESLDDLVAEANADGSDGDDTADARAGEADPDAELAAEPEPEPAPARAPRPKPAPVAPAAKKKRKKISF
jgi:tetratricopeptide (TPR) repeat protein